MSYISGHLGASVEADRFLSITKVLLRLDIHIRQSCQVLFADQGDIPGSLEIRLVKARNSLRGDCEYFHLSTNGGRDSTLRASVGSI